MLTVTRTESLRTFLLYLPGIVFLTCGHALGDEDCCNLSYPPPPDSTLCSCTYGAGCPPRYTTGLAVGFCTCKYAAGAKQCLAPTDVPIATINVCTSDVNIGWLLSELGIYEIAMIMACIGIGAGTGPGAIIALLFCLSLIFGNTAWFIAQCGYISCGGGAFLEYVTVTASTQVVGPACGDL